MPAVQTGQRLLESATEAFAAKGFHGTTTRDIAAAAGVTPGAVYVHHRSKEELLYSISKLGHERTLELVRACASTSSNPVEQIRTMVRDFVEWQSSNRTKSAVVNFELAALSDEHRAEVLDIRRAVDAEFRTVVDRGREQGLFNVPDTSLAVFALLSLCIDVARWYRSDGRLSAAAIGEHHSSMALRMLGAAA
ncbi:MULTISPECIES: TetR/AcrR family transcriptional regulator [unclassified Arthrobacter]|uniref:TetR/AcrR family transcriptional regulator n=1 Tax=unclassified Arthrobacter TaxID=235627 RepID=UPI001D14DB16|nr:MULTISPECIES: TetR/AcrR family transcriptional regulator [unclassified Arthrobacter]MCC3274596.1 TetR/AcrR family transcriptional regulator [Arthrobacter sp. zg-Y20]MCC9177815.1 TetR/AcrR family transcriptional regulator [Arthrobacter sp. zg-Y750]MDK1314753.1 TetR/AcrR family transcriptional regulator [Arthrobacter sp. zg.Y20]WIB07729.1 TetR/AcrR family transcriptional regulator [Arthrobacter sp. zg-Y20]